MHQANLLALTKSGVNPCLLPLITAKYTERDEVKAALSERIHLKEFDTKTGDGAERADNETSIEQANIRAITLRLHLRKLNGLLNVLEDPDYDGYCTVCGDDVSTVRIKTQNSTLCVNCAQLAEQQ